MDSGLVERRRRHRADLFARLPELTDRLGWSSDRLTAWRQTRLRDVVRAAQKAPWHRQRLGGLDTNELDCEDLSALPVMSKPDMMEHLDEVLTDPRLTRASLEAHLARDADNPYLLDTYHVLASGGSSGVRGVYVFDWDGWINYCGAIMRNRVARGTSGGAVMARVSADSPSHASAAISATMNDPDLPSVRLPVTLPLADIVAGLNRSQPGVVMGYPSALAELAAETQAGRLHMTPQLVIAHSEPLLPEVRHLLEDAWGARVDNSYGTSEGTFAYSCPTGRGMHLADDLAIVELVDDDGQPVRPGQPASKLYLTNLFNHTQPLIRYELSDQFTPIDGVCGCGSAHTWIEEPLGRLDDVFVYPDGTRIHPHVIRSPLSRTATIVEYQVVQTTTGVHIPVVGDPDLSPEQITDELTHALRSAGLVHPVVTVQPVDRLERLASGKVRRFVPLPPDATQHKHI